MRRSVILLTPDSLLQEGRAGDGQGCSCLDIRQGQRPQPGRQGGEDVQSAAEILAGLQVGPGHPKVTPNTLHNPENCVKVEHFKILLDKYLENIPDVPLSTADKKYR